MAQPTVNQELATRLTKQGILTQQAMQDAINGTWNMIPDIERNTATTEEAANQLVLKYLDSYLGPKTGNVGGNTSVQAKATSIMADDKREQLDSNTMAALQQNIDRTSRSKFENTLQEGLNATIVELYSSRPSASEKLGKNRDFVPDEIEEAQWKKWESLLPTTPKMKTNKDTKAEEPVFSVEDNKKAFFAIKQKALNKDKFSINISTSKAPLLGMRVKKNDGSDVYISKDPATLAWKLIDQFGGQIGNPEHPDELSAYIRVTTKTATKVSGVTDEVPKVTGVISGLKQWYEGGKNKPTAAWVETKEMTKATVKSADFFWIYDKKSDNDPKMVYKKIRISGKIDVVKTVPKDDVIFADMRVKSTTKKGSTSDRSGNTLSANKSNQTKAGQAQNFEIFRAAYRSLAAGGFAGVDAKNNLKIGKTLANEIQASLEVAGLVGGNGGSKFGR